MKHFTRALCWSKRTALALASALCMLNGGLVGCMVEPDAEIMFEESSDTDDDAFRAISLEETGLPELEECLEDSDCAVDEYCWEPPVGPDPNECRSKKLKGASCERHAECLSSCCPLVIEPFGPPGGGRSCEPANSCFHTP